MKQLSKEQMQAVNAVEGQILVIACPGSGKTTTLIARIKHMLDIGISASSMLNITFTKAAADEMASRFAQEYGTEVKFSTIHSFCFNMLCKEFGLTIESIMKESDKWRILFEFLSECSMINPSEVVDLINPLMQEISYVKNKEINADTYTSQCCEREVFYDAFRYYENEKKESGKIDFDDMLILARDSFKNHPDVLSKYQQIYKYISIDEFQDVNRIQAEIAYMLAGDNGNLFVVGDDDQSIYRFRASDSRIMLDFPKKYPNCQMIHMGTNYRSGKIIVKLAGWLIAENRTRFDKAFTAYREDNGSFYLAPYQENMIQAKEITNQIQKIHVQGTPYEDIAILYRTNKCAVPFIASLMKAEIPFYTSELPKSHHGDIYDVIIAYYRIAGKQEKRGDLKKILNSPSRYLKASHFKNCSCELNQLLKCCDTLPNKDAAKDKIFQLMDDLSALSKKESPKEFIDYLQNEMGYRRDLEKKAEYYKKPVDEYTGILDLLYEEASRFDDFENWIRYVEFYEKKMQEVRRSKTKKGVCFSTFHSSKGLEWKTVFVVNANDGMTPYNKAETAAELEEERRMFYVAITRAKDSLYVSYIDNEKSFPTPYLSDMRLNVKVIGKGSNDLKLSENGLG